MEKSEERKGIASDNSRLTDQIDCGKDCKSHNNQPRVGIRVDREEDRDVAEVQVEEAEAQEARRG